MADSFTVEASAEWHISHLKQEIEKIHEIPAQEQKLLQGAQLLEDAVPVASLQQESDGSIALFLVRDGSEIMKWIGMVATGWKTFCRRDDDGHTYVGPETPEWVWTDRRIVIAMIHCWHDSFAMPDFLKLAADHIRADKHVVSLGVKYKYEALEHAADELKADDCFMVDAINIHPHSIRYASDELWRNHRVVHAALKKDYRTFKYAGHELQHDPKFVLSAVRCDCRVLIFAQRAMMVDKDFLLAAVRANWRVLKLTRTSGWSDKSISRACDGDDSTVLCKLTKMDSELGRAALLDALRHDWQAIQHALDVHLSDPEIMLIVALKDPRALQYASPEVFTDQEFLVRLLKQVRGALAYIPEQFRKKRNLVMLALEQDGCALQWASPDLKEDCEIAIVAVTQNWRALEFVAPSLTSCRAIVQAAAKQSKSALRYADPSLRDWKKLMDPTSDG